MNSNDHTGPALILAFLTGASAWILFEGAQNEPYATLSRYDALTQVGVACSLITAWLLFAIRILVRIRQGTLAGAWILAAVWAAVVLLYLLTSPLGYLSNLTQFHGAL